MPVEVGDLAALDETVKDDPVVGMEIDEGGDFATIHLARPIAGERSVRMKRPQAGQWIKARELSKSDEESYARLISFTTGLSYGAVSNLDLGDYMRLKEAVEALAGF